MQTCIDPDVFKICPCKLAGVHTISKSVYAHCIVPYVSKICPCKLAGSQIFCKWRHAVFGDQRKTTEHAQKTCGGALLVRDARRNVAALVPFKKGMLPYFTITIVAPKPYSRNEASWKMQVL